jgi:hypothetical protein
MLCSIYASYRILNVGCLRREEGVVRLQLVH